MHTKAPLEGLDQKGRVPVGQPVIFPRWVSVFFFVWKEGVSV